MAQDTRLARLLHVLIHMHLLGGVTTSATLARMLHTNEVVVRRIMAPLRSAGLVASNGGRGGGWTLGRTLDGVTARDVHNAVAYGSALAIGPSHDNPACPVEASINRLIGDALTEAERAFLETLGSRALSELAAEIMANH